MITKHTNAKPVPLAWTAVITPFLDFLKAGGYPPTTVDTRKQHLDFLARRINTAPADVTEAQLLSWCAAQNWQPETRRGRNNTYRQFWRWCEEMGYLTNVAANLPSPRQKPGIPRPAPEDVYMAALFGSDDRTRLILRLAGEAGLRRGEIAMIHTGRDLLQDLVGWSLIVHGKGNKQRLVPLAPGLADALLKLETGWAFPGDVCGHISIEWVGRLAARALPGEWTLHSLRRRFATRTYEIDRDLFAVQELLGHSSPETTRRYVLTDQRRLRRLVDLVSGGPTIAHLDRDSLAALGSSVIGLLKNRHTLADSVADVLQTIVIAHGLEHIIPEQAAVDAHPR